jgi:hypothetical protein
MPTIRLIIASICHPNVHTVFKTFPRATHNEQAWSARLWEPLVFLFGHR